MRPQSPPLSSFGWTIAGALALGLSFPPTSFYPLAWVALVPWIVRWRLATEVAPYAREIYATVLVWSCAAGFWLLFHPSASRALLGGLGILLVPIPLALAFIGALGVRLRHGAGAGLVALVANVLVVEYLLLRVPGGVPWLLLGHTQASATSFIQIAELGGVLIVSAWVLGINVLLALLVPRLAARSAAVPVTIGARGLVIGAVALLIVLPVMYGAARAARPDTPVGYTRVGLVQPGVAPHTWEASSPASRVEALASLSSTLLVRWRGGTRTDSDTLSDSALVRGYSADGSLGTLIWPNAALPDLGSDDKGARLLARLTTWSAHERVALLAGTSMARPHATPVGTASDAASPRTAEERTPASAALLVRTDRAPLRYDQMRRMPMADARVPRGSSRVLFPVGGARLATAIGFESVYGDHLRTFARDGADAFVVLAQTGWWGRGGQAQHLAFTRFRAIETQRAVVVATVGGGSAMVTPTGEIETLAGWMQPALVPLDVPLYRQATVYTTHGDWPGRLAMWVALSLYFGMALLHLSRPHLPGDLRERLWATQPGSTPSRWSRR